MEIISRFKKIFQIDLRALSIFRIFLALLLIFDLIVRSLSLSAHYTNFGVLPLNIYLENFADSRWISLHNLGGSLTYQIFLFSLAFLFALSLLVGYKTKLSIFVSWFLLISLHSRNPYVLQGGDVMLRLLFFWAIFLPLGARYSIDSKLKNYNFKDKNFFSFWTAGILLQVAFVYFFSALLKTGNEWIKDGTAIYYSLQLDQFATYFGKFLLEFPDFLIYLTYFVYLVEFIGPVFLFMPFLFKQFRIVTSFTFIFLLIGMALSLRLGHFPFVGITAFVLFLPSAFWDFLARRLRIFRNKTKFGYFDKEIINYGNYFLFISNFIALFFIIYVLLWNVQTLGKINAISDDFEFISYNLRIDQYWNMFSPYPLKEDGWYIIEGRLSNGEVIDLFRNGDLVNYEKPEHVASLYKGERWRKYLMNLWDRSYEVHRKYYLNYLCNDWNIKHPDKIVSHITLNFMLEVTGPDFKIEPIEKINLEERECIS